MIGIELSLVGRGTDMQVWAARRPPTRKGHHQDTDPEDPLAGYRKLASVRGASDLVTLRFSPPVDDRPGADLVHRPAGIGRTAIAVAWSRRPSFLGREARPQVDSRHGTHTSPRGVNTLPP